MYTELNFIHSGVRVRAELWTDRGVNGIGVASHASVERVEVTGWPIVSQIIKPKGLTGCEISLYK